MPKTDLELPFNKSINHNCLPNCLIQDLLVAQGFDTAVLDLGTPSDFTYKDLNSLAGPRREREIYIYVYCILYSILVYKIYNL